MTRSQVYKEVEALNKRLTRTKLAAHYENAGIKIEVVNTAGTFAIAYDLKPSEASEILTVLRYFNAALDSEEEATRGHFTKQGYDVLDSLVDVLQHREIGGRDDIEAAIENKFGADGLYDRFVGPMIDEIQRELGLEESEVQS